MIPRTPVAKRYPIPAKGRPAVVLHFAKNAVKPRRNVKETQKNGMNPPENCDFLRFVFIFRLEFKYFEGQ